MTLSLPKTSRGLSGCSAFAILLALGVWSTVSSGSRVVAGSRCAGDSSAVFLDPGVFSGGDNNSVDAVSEKRRRDRVASTFTAETDPENAELVLAGAGKTDLKDTESVLAVAGETDPENAEMVLVAAGETEREVAESVRSLAGSVDRELRQSGPSVRLIAHATASESTGIIGSLVFGRPESSLPNSHNSSMGVACVDLASAAVASLAPVCSSARSRVACAAGAVHARRTVSPMHAAHSHNSWSDTVRSQGPTWEEEGTKEWGFQSGRRFASCLRGGGRGKFSAGRQCAGAGAGSLLRRHPGTGTRQVR